MCSSPLLHDLVSTVRAPGSALSGPDGQIRPVGVQGVFHADVRVLTGRVLRVDDREPDAVGARPGGPGVTSFVALARWLGDRGPDPTVRVTATRRMAPAGLEETVTVVVDRVRAGHVHGDAGGRAATSRPSTWSSRAGRSRPAGRSRRARAATAGAGPAAGPLSCVTGDAAAAADAGRGCAGRSRWRRAVRWSCAGGVKVDGHPGGRTVAPGPTSSGRARGGGRRPAAGPPAVALPGRPRVAAPAADRRPGRHLRRRRGALVPDPLRPRQPVDGADAAAAGHRPRGAGTLRVLAGRQGRSVDQRTGEEPGKILHELRRHNVVLAPGVGLARSPTTARSTPRCCGSACCTTRGGGACRRHRSPTLLPTLEAALELARRPTRDADGDGFVEYIDHNGHGLANQGWKDSGDSVRFRSGRIAAPPIALGRGAGVRPRGRARRRRPAGRLREAGRRPVAGLRGRISPSGSAPRSGSTARPAPIRRWRWTARSGRSTRSPATSATCSAPAS